MMLLEILTAKRSAIENRIAVTSNNIILINRWCVPFQVRDFTGKWDIRNIFIPRKKEIREQAFYCVNHGVQFIIEITKRTNFSISLYCKYRQKFYCGCDTDEKLLDEELNVLIQRMYIWIYMNWKPLAKE